MEAVIKNRIHSLVDELPAESTVEDLMRELLELRSIERAFADIAAGRLTPHEEAKQTVLQGLKKR